MLPHHDGSATHVSNPAPALGETVTVFARVPETAGVSQVHLRTTPDGEPHFVAAVPDRRRGGEVWWRAEVPVHNPVTSYRFWLTGPGGDRWLNQYGVVGHDVPDATDFRLVADAPPPQWHRDAVVYQIFPDRFARSAAADQHPPPEWAVPCDWDTPVVGLGPETPYQFYGGDLGGVEQRLDHLAQLGINTVYLTPVFPARSNHRYDAAGFDQIDPLLGGDAALASLAAAVHARGWRILGDLTTNHCGDAHPWFAAAVSEVAAAERELFYLDPAGDYESWRGVKSLPKFNWGSAELRRRFFDGPDAVLARWLRPPYRLDGWRIDVANMTGRLRADDYASEVAAAARAAVAAARPDALLVAEHAHDATGDLDRGGWHGTMNYAGFLRPVWSWLRGPTLDLADFLGVPGEVPRRDGGATLTTMRTFAAAMSWRSLAASWNLLGSHDTARIRTVVGDPARQEVAAGLLFTLPGTPMVFAGDEWGLTGVNGEDSRTPMPWHRPERQDRRTFDTYRALIALRHAEPALRHGGLRWLHADPDALVFVRETPAEAVLVLARRAAGTPVRLAGFDAGAAAVNHYGGGPDLRGDAEGVLTLPADGPTLQVWRLG
ncbi:glycoside hydrolase family 13 protein [Natronosporangium hydrolyticum]|uniref:glycoside hydrolase family 13 protein n=1 Tax=Natronosporangium hydrolyticum TaxID=2811111 RepID=UPI001EFA2538|nr:glycoside hydrolase family 13 protein [Natronosporangium hydrolyticum]